MNTIALIPSRPRRVARSVGAVLAGLVLNAVLATATDMLFIAVGVFPPLSEYGHANSFTDSMLALALVYRTLYGVLGCYVTAWLASGRPMLHSLVLGGVGFAIGVVGAIAMWGVSATWYSLAIIAVSVPCAWVGGRWYEKRLAKAV